MAAIDFLKRQATYAAQRLLKNRTATKIYRTTPGSGRTINGWTLGTMRSWSEDPIYYTPGLPTDFEQERHEMILVLATDGSLYTYTETAHEFGAAQKGGARTEHSSTVMNIYTPDFSAPHYISVKRAIEIVQALGHRK